MSRLSDLQAKIHTLAEIQSIFGAMKNLAIIEMNKVSRLMSAQVKISETIDAAIADFELFYQAKHSIGSLNKPILCLLIGSERGFCGPFNEGIIVDLHKVTKENPDLKLAIVGQKLAAKLEGDPRVVLQIAGPNSADEIQSVIIELGAKLLPYASSRWMFIQNIGNGSGNHDSVSFPLEARLSPTTKPYAYPPLLNMSPQDLYPQLMEQHLFSIMHRAFYSSFMAENRERLRHMEGALNQIEKDRTLLSLKLNGQRQEEVTEELEILMLSSLSVTSKETL